MIDWVQIEKDVVAVSQEVGAFIANEALSFNADRVERKESFNNLVSYVDKESERRLVKALDQILPGAGFLGEEGTSVKGSNEFRWIIDPLDGTTNFTHGLPPYAISIGLAQNNEVILGVIHEVTRNECFHASVNNPAYCNGEEIRVSKVNSINESLFATGFPYYHFDKTDEYMEIIKTFLELSHGVRRMGSAATDLAYVACGRIEGFFEYNLNPWDVAAGAIIVQQAGGQVSDFKGGDNYLFGGQIIAGGGVQPEMVNVIKPRWGYS
ncbi:MAG: inositol monophosphatase family protein [Cyclobacteriaceae bacterium]